MTTATPDAPALDTHKAQAAAILTRCVCLVLNSSYLGNSRKVDLKQLKVAKVSSDGSTEQALNDTEKKQLRAQKLLVDSKHLQAATREIESTKNMLRARSAAMGHRVFGAGTYLIPIAGLLEVEQELKTRKIRIREHAKSLGERWGQIIANRAKELGPLYNPKEFATRDEVEAAFDIDWSYVSFTAPDQLLDVDRGMYEAAVAKHEQKLSEAYDEVVVQLRAAALTMMKELVVRLQPGADGKPKALHPTALRDLQEYVARLPKRNVTNDAELEQAVAAVASYAEGLDVDTLRKAPAVRMGLQRAAEDAVKALETLVATASSRAITFGKIPGAA